LTQEVRGSSDIGRRTMRLRRATRSGLVIFLMVEWSLGWEGLANQTKALVRNPAPFLALFLGG